MNSSFSRDGFKPQRQVEASTLAITLTILGLLSLGTGLGLEPTATEGIKNGVGKLVKRK